MRRQETIGNLFDDSVDLGHCRPGWTLGAALIAPEQPPQKLHAVERGAFGATRKGRKRYRKKEGKEDAMAMRSSGNARVATARANAAQSGGKP